MLLSSDHLYVTASFVLLFHAVTWVPDFTSFGPSALQIVEKQLRLSDAKYGTFIERIITCPSLV
eukprot:14818463-Ditylum_brightwellii.AAC.1